MHKIILRDDDVNYFTRVSEIKQLVDMCPESSTIVLGAVPFIRPGVCGCIPPYNWRDSDCIFPIHKNAELVKYLYSKIQAGKVEIAQHGIEHYYRPNQGRFEPEFWDRNFSAEKIQAAKEYLESTFSCQIRWFIPPSNKISKSNYSNVSKLFQGIFNVPSRSCFNRPVSALHLRRWIERIPSGDSLAKYGVTHVKDCFIEIPSVDLSFISDRDIETIAALPRQNTFALASHYWELIGEDGIKIALYRRKLDALVDLGCKFWHTSQQLT